MEFRLNRIEPETRQRVNHMTKEGVIHSKSKLMISSYSEEFQNERIKRFRKRPKDQEFSNMLKKNSITVKAVKVNTIEVKASLENTNPIDTPKGVFLDIKR